MTRGEYVVILAGTYKGKRGKVIDSRAVRAPRSRYIYVRLGPKKLTLVDECDARLISPLEKLAEVAE